MNEFKIEVFERLGISPQEFFKVTTHYTEPIWENIIIMIDVDFKVYALADYDEENDANILVELNNSKDIINILLKNNVPEFEAVQKFKDFILNGEENVYCKYQVVKLPKEFNMILSNRKNIIIQYIDEVY